MDIGMTLLVIGAQYTETGTRVVAGWVQSTVTRAPVPRSPGVNLIAASLSV